MNHGRTQFMDEPHIHGTVLDKIELGVNLREDAGGLSPLTPGNR